MTRRAAALGLALLAGLLVPARGAAEDSTVFSEWTPEAFARAKREKRILLVYVGTTWCHWCHVMQRETFGDPRVRSVLARSFLPVRADGDERPDLAERFREYRWPATAFLTSEGTPILALRGHRPADEFLRILADVEARVRTGGPYPGFDAPAPVAATRGETGRDRLLDVRKRLLSQLDGWWDSALAGWGMKQKYPIPEPIEHGLMLGRLARASEGPELERALATLSAEEALLDPVWGGMWQYSEVGTWKKPHFEKIVSVNAGALSNFADAFAVTQDARWLSDARSIVRWLREFLRDPESGAFYTSQDADGPGGMPGERYYALGDAERRRIGLPRVDRAIRRRENALVIQALCRLAVTGEALLLEDALRAADVVLLRSDERPRTRATEVEVGRACLALHLETGDVRWLARARECADLLRTDLVDATRGGFYDREPERDAPGALAERIRSLEPNAAAARFLLGVAVLTEDDALREAALGAIVAMADPASLERHGRWVGGLLLAVEEALLPWARIEVVGPRGDPAADALFVEARRLARARPLVLVLRREPGEAETGQARALVCGEGTCSDPVLVPDGLARALLRVLGPS